MAEVAAALGTPLMGWQREVVDAALELDGETGRLCYREVVLSTPRQQGKSLLLLATMVHRARHWPGSRILYAAQSRLHAHARWEDVHLAALDVSPLRAEYTVRRQRGDEAIRWRNGSWHGITAPGETAGHGDTLDLGIVDEAWVHEDARLEQGLSPTMVTRPQPQLWVVSTAGTPRSTYLRGKVDRGRARAEAGVRETVAHFEWAADPAADPADPATWRACMPALGHTVTEQTIADEFERLDLADFCRAYCNWWPGDVPTGWQVIPEAVWRALADPAPAVADPVAFAADTTPERSWSTIAAAGGRPGGGIHVEVVAHDPGTAWVAPKLAALAGRWRPCAVVVDPAGPAGSLIPALTAAGLEVVTPSVGDAARAAGALYDDVVGGSLRYAEHPALTAAVAGARKRPLGDSWAWARKGGTVISPLVAVTLARWGWQTRAHLAAGGPAIYP